MGGKRTMKLGALFHGMGHHAAAWRHGSTQADLPVSFAHYAELARLAESACLDLIFLDDHLAVREQNPRALRRTADFTIQLEPLSLLSALAAVTSRIGLVATASTTYNEPFHVARKFASIDHISGGRAGWNLVTSITDQEARNFGRETHLAHDNRYERAEEFADVVTGLWDSWEDGAFPRDKSTGIYCDPAKMHTLGHRGEHFSVRGPLNVARPPQGRPVVFQAGSSEPGKRLAARTAEVIFTPQPTLALAQAFYADVKGRLPAFGRAEDELIVMPGVLPVVGRTESEAQAKFQELQDLVDPEIGLLLLGHLLGDIDLTGCPIDGPLPELPPSNAGLTRRENLVGMARRENLTIRQLYQRVTGGRDHWKLVGTPAQIADALQERFENQAADGFIVMLTHMPAALTDFVGLVVPELRRRGLFRSHYEGRTLRDHLGLPRPVHASHAQKVHATSEPVG